MRNCLELGDVAPDFDLVATDGERFSLASFSANQLLVVVFLANQCPFVVAWEDRLIMLAVEHTGRGAAFIAVNSRLPTHHPEDNSEMMRRHAHEKRYPFPYVGDTDGAWADRLGATVTPEVFVFDNQRTLRYHGAIDSDAHHPTNARPYLRSALDALIAGKPPAIERTEAVGCPLESPKD